MAFQVYYRKWRPQRFSDVVGQEHVSSTLRQAVKQSRIGHSYLFSGPRGTGKTSTARVLAKAANCLDPQDGDPCNQCVVCQSVNEGRYMDLIELDAASNRGIDEIRNIRDKVNLSPVEGGSKVYIIDEAHMLTEHASNAFLKTLEEPPPHAIFVLCTTEPQKIVPTIISRCQRFDFRRINSEAVTGRLTVICTDEGVKTDPEALRAVARFAEGSLRDAENLLEQLVVSYGSRFGISEVYDLLGLGHGEAALELTRYLLARNAPAALGAINRAAWDGIDLRQLHRQTVDLLRGVLLLQWKAKDATDLPQDTIDQLEQLASKTSAAVVTKALRRLGEVNIKYDSPSPLALELAVVEVCAEPTLQQVATDAVASPRVIEAPKQRDVTGDKSLEEISPPAAESKRERIAEPASEPVPVTRRPASSDQEAVSNIPTQDSSDAMQETPEPMANNLSVQPETLEKNWGTLIKILSRNKGKRFYIGPLLKDCKNNYYLDGDTLVLPFTHQSHMERVQSELDDPQGIKAVEEAILKSFGGSYQLKLTLAGGGKSTSPPTANDSHLVRAAISMGARITEERDL